MKIKITKRIKLWELNCDKCHNYYYGIKGRIINDDNTKYKKFTFVVSFDIFDAMEYFEQDSVSQQELLMYVDVLTDSMLSYIKSYNDCKHFYSLCNETIDTYNKLIR